MFNSRLFIRGGYRASPHAAGTVALPGYFTSGEAVTTSASGLPGGRGRRKGRRNRKQKEEWGDKRKGGLRGGKIKTGKKKKVRASQTTVIRFSDSSKKCSGLCWQMAPKPSTPTPGNSSFLSPQPPTTAPQLIYFLLSSLIYNDNEILFLEEF